ncbi:acyl-CoA dehydrogenase family protein [Mycobacterium palustre]|uniref:Uncharacterized protein n=1 Tax=Mycobacterium palustre TaxID=153971 RepID=A0A1X1ZQH0_9MYCO|nr:acyl-CoA dehydrogenase family protein [Mycobacterium palustre]MCV7103564.1 hypothetical protein [Mycobacterium palustre]ORW25498.1 hypothetical protein AWC19_06995 [Mycobacterium palustre]
MTLRTGTRDPGQSVRELAPLLESRAEEARRAHDLLAEQVDPLFDAGLFWLLVPECLGGHEASVTDAFEVFENLTHIDGSIGWTVMATAHTTALMGAYLSDAAVTDIFADPRALSAGQLAPLGSAVAEGDSLRVQGSFVFATGSAHANWMMGGYREFGSDGEPVRQDNGLPSMHVVVVPKSAVQLDDDWNVLGLEATGSVNFRVPEQLVPVDFSWQLLGGKPLRGGGLYRMGPFGLGCIAHSAFSIGIARRALGEIAALAMTKRRAGRPVLVDDPVFQADYGRAEAALDAARAGSIEALRNLERAAATDSVDARHRGLARLSTTHAARIGVEVTGFAHRYAGSAGLRNGTAIQRCFRDIAASEAHMFTDHSSWADAAAAVLTGRASPFL